MTLSIIQESAIEEDIIRVYDHRVYGVAGYFGLKKQIAIKTHPHLLSI